MQYSPPEPEGMFLGTSNSLARSIPLLKFAGQDPYFCQDGLDALSRCGPDICVVAFTGDGRSGKSWLANQYVRVNEYLPHGATVFKTGGTGEPVTDGIDMHILTCPHSQSTTVLLDCEGGNNPATSLKNFVNVMAMRFANLIVDVSWGRFTDAQLQHIGYALVVRDQMLPGDADFQLPKQHLLLVANDCRLRYSADTLSSMMNLDKHRTQDAQDLVQLMHETFMLRKHHIVGSPWRPSYAREFSDAIQPLCLTSTLHGAPLAGPQLVTLFNKVKEAWTSTNRITYPSIVRSVLYDQILSSFVTKRAGQFDSSLPPDTEYFANLAEHDNRNSYIKLFEGDAQHVKREDFVDEARTVLQGKLDKSWKTTEQQNQVFGMKTKEVLQNQKEKLLSKGMRVDGHYRAFLWFYRERRQHYETHQTLIMSTTVRHNGEQNIGEWLATGAISTQNTELEFESLCAVQ